MTSRLTLISHVLCPYVQRAVIVLHEKQIPFDRIDIDLANKPEWFLKISPLGKTPVLLVDGEPVFESAVICEYLEEVTSHRLHPQDPLARARHRGWMEFASSTLNAIGALYNAPDETALALKVKDLGAKFAQLETALDATRREGPYFSGQAFSLVDAAFAPVFRYFDVFDMHEDFGILANKQQVLAWRSALQQRPSVRTAVGPDYGERLHAFLLQRKSALSLRMAAAQRHTTALPGSLLHSNQPPSNTLMRSQPISQA